jgi:hypothetical protein
MGCHEVAKDGRGLDRDRFRWSLGLKRLRSCCCCSAANLGAPALPGRPLLLDTANARVAGWGNLVDAIEKVLALKERLFLSLEV